MEICLGGKGLMPGIAKRKYDGESIRIAKSMTRPLNLIRGKFCFAVNSY